MADSRGVAGSRAPEDSSKCIYFQSLPELAARPSWHLKCIFPLLSNSREEPMQLSKSRNVLKAAATLAMILSSGIPGFAQETAQEPERQAPMRAPEPPRQKADGERRGLPLETYAVAPGTKFLVKLEDDLSTKGTPENAKFKARTLEPGETLAHVRRDSYQVRQAAHRG